ncbi:hypothetical protein Tco_1070140 [Tanacetum coccineum]|uniref:Uncharacterized protein n=1 Tax=Tanacetum coccineum TaxID=301880 RepID=A0ABQ5HKJ4_9ASTR
MRMSNSEGSSSTTPIASSNIETWLEEVTVLVYHNRVGWSLCRLIKEKQTSCLGAPEIKKPPNTVDQKNAVTDKTGDKLSKRSKAKISKKMRKAQELEKKLQEKEFERAFYREFWPDNV